MDRLAVTGSAVALMALAFAVAFGVFDETTTTVIFAVFAAIAGATALAVILFDRK